MPGASVALMADRLVELFPEVARVAADLVRRPEVARRWADESSCAGMSVGGLANHLAGQAANVVRLLAAPPSGQAPIPALEHYRRAAWVHTGLDDEANVDVRTSADAYAAVRRRPTCASACARRPRRPAGGARPGARRHPRARLGAHPVAGLVAVGRRLRAHPDDGGARALRRPRREHRRRDARVSRARRRMPCSASSRRSPPSGTARPPCCARSAARSARPGPVSAF